MTAKQDPDAPSIIPINTHNIVGKSMRPNYGSLNMIEEDDVEAISSQLEDYMPEYAPKDPVNLSADKQASPEELAASRDKINKDFYAQFSKSETVNEEENNVLCAWCTPETRPTNNYDRFDPGIGGGKSHGICSTCGDKMERDNESCYEAATVDKFAQIVNEADELLERNYAKEYANYQGKPDQKKRRAQRNKDRRQFERDGKVKPGDGRDVHHRNGNPSDHSSGNTSAISMSVNRSIKERSDPVGNRRLMMEKVLHIVRERLTRIVKESKHNLKVLNRDGTTREIPFPPMKSKEDVAKKRADDAYARALANPKKEATAADMQRDISKVRTSAERIADKVNNKSWKPAVKNLASKYDETNNPHKDFLGQVASDTKANKKYWKQRNKKGSPESKKAALNAKAAYYNGGDFGKQ